MMTSRVVKFKALHDFTFGMIFHDDLHDCHEIMTPHQLATEMRPYNPTYDTYRTSTPPVSKFMI